MKSINHQIIGSLKNMQNTMGSGKEKGTFLSLIEMSFIHPFSSKLINIKYPEPAKFDVFRIKEEKFWEKKNKDLLENVDLNSSINDVRPIAYKTGISRFIIL